MTEKYLQKGWVGFYYNIKFDVKFIIMWSANKCTRSMFKKYWRFVCLIILGYILIVITANSSI